MHLLTLITKIFHYLPEEIAHRFALSGLKVIHSVGILKILLGKNFIEREISDESIDKTTYKNKLGIAAGLDKDGEYIDSLSALGIGFLEVGTVTPLQQQGNAKPRLFRNRSEKSLLNRLGFNNKGVEALVENLKKRNSTIPIGVSIGKNFDTPNDEAYKDYLFCMEKVYEYSSYIAINISSPNTKELRELSNKKFLKDLLCSLKDKQNKLSESFEYVPIYIKISPDEKLEDLENICKSIMQYEIDGIIDEGDINLDSLQNIGSKKITHYKSISEAPVENIDI